MLKKTTNPACYGNNTLPCWRICTVSVIPLACERVITCRVRAFTLFPETPWRVTLNEPERSCGSSKVNCIGYETREKLIMFWNPRYGRTSVENKPTGVHPFNSSQGDSITNQHFMGGVCE